MVRDDLRVRIFAYVGRGLAILSMLGTLFRTQLSLRVENVALRHQLAIYQRTVKRASIRPGDRLLWSWLSRRWVWGEERIANELLLKLGLRVSPRTVRKHMPRRPPGRARCDQRWSTFLRNHARAIVACDFFVVVTATFRLFYVLALVEHGSRRLVHLNITQHPTADWTLQQLREAIGCADAYRYLLHDRDSIFARSLDDSIRNLGLTAL